MWSPLLSLLEQLTVIDRDGFWQRIGRLVAAAVMPLAGMPFGEDRVQELVLYSAITLLRRAYTGANDETAIGVHHKSQNGGGQ